MKVEKRNGKLETVSFDKVIYRLKSLCRTEPKIDIDIISIAQKVVSRIYDGVKTTELDELSARICTSNITVCPDYGKLASRIIISNNHKITSPSFSETIYILYNNKNKHGKQNPLIAEDIYKLVMKNKDKLNNIINYNRDFNFDYFAFKTLEKAYLMKVNGKITERIQHMILRTSLGIHKTDIKKVIETYNLISKKYFTHATPTLFHSGTPRPQLLSCFLLGVDDSIKGIYKCISDCAIISKWAGGIGIHISNIRSKNSVIRGTNGISSGIVPMLRVFNDTARYVNQCFAPETLIYTDVGNKQIKNIKIGDKVITLDGTFKNVLQVIKKNKICHNMMYIQNEHVPKIKCTSVHEIMIIERKYDKYFGPLKNFNLNKEIQNGRTKIISVPAKKLMINDILVYPIPKFGNHFTQEIVNYLKDFKRHHKTYRIHKNKYISDLRTGFLKTCFIFIGQIPKFKKKGDYLEFVFPDLIRNRKTNYCFSQIKKLERFDYEGPVYDLNIENNHNYLTDIGLVHNSGKRNGSFAIYLEPWHYDIMEFLELRKNHGDENARARDLFYALWIPDLFMKKVENDEDWCLFCPDQCKELVNSYGEKFNKIYYKYEKEGLFKKKINAREIWKQVVISQIETGNPYILFKNAANKKSNQKNLGTIKSSNLCVAPETLILTDNGYQEIQTLKNKMINIWNGKEFSKVIVKKTGENQELISISFSNGSKLTCTKYHKFYVNQDGCYCTVEAKDLVLGMTLVEWDLPSHINMGHLTNCFSKNVKITHIDNKTVISDTYCFTESTRHAGIFNGVLTGQCSEIIEYSDDKEYACCTLASVCLPSFVDDPEIPDGKFKIYSKKNCEFCELSKMLFKHFNIDFTNVICDNKKNRDGLEKLLKTKHNIKLKTFPQIFHNEKHIGGYDELEDLLRPKYNFKKLYEIVKVVIRNLDRIVDVNFYPIKETKLSNMRHRPLGLGVQGLADVYCKMRYPFDGKKASQLNKEIFATIYYGALVASNELAIENEPYSTFKGSPLSEGKFQFDLWDSEPIREVNGLKLDWDILRKKIKKKGVRNSLLLAPMPTASTSQIMGNNECIEPFTSNIYVRRTIAGDFIVVNKFLMQDFINLGIWNKEMKDIIVYHEGSIQEIKNVPLRLKQLYKTSWDLSQKTLIDQAADRGIYICQSQSLNLFLQSPTQNQISSMHFYSWKKGLKTGIYYLRTKAVTKSQQFTIEPELKEKIDNFSGNKKEICESCSG